MIHASAASRQSPAAGARFAAAEGPLTAVAGDEGRRAGQCTRRAPVRSGTGGRLSRLRRSRRATRYYRCSCGMRHRSGHGVRPCPVLLRDGMFRRAEWQHLKNGDSSCRLSSCEGGRQPALPAHCGGHLHMGQCPDLHPGTVHGDPSGNVSSVRQIRVKASHVTPMAHTRRNGRSGALLHRLQNRHAPHVVRHRKGVGPDGCARNSRSGTVFRLDQGDGQGSERQTSVTVMNG